MASDGRLSGDTAHGRLHGVLSLELRPLHRAYVLHDAELDGPAHAVP
ncbi:hypothetical protein [Streptomyces fungicidicus]